MAPPTKNKVDTSIRKKRTACKYTLSFLAKIAIVLAAIQRNVNPYP